MCDQGSSDTTPLGTIISGLCAKHKVYADDIQLLLDHVDPDGISQKKSQLLPDTFYEIFSRSTANMKLTRAVKSLRGSTLILFFSPRARIYQDSDWVMNRIDMLQLSEPTQHVWSRDCCESDLKSIPQIFFLIREFYDIHLVRIWTSLLCNFPKNTFFVFK